MALKKDQLIVQDLPVGRGQAPGPRYAAMPILMIGIQTNLFFTMSMSQHAMRVRMDEFVGLGSPMDRMRNGGARRDRTDDLKLAKLALSQLSYGPCQGQ